MDVVFSANPCFPTQKSYAFLKGRGGWGELIRFEWTVPIMTHGK